MSSPLYCILSFIISFTLCNAVQGNFLQCMSIYSKNTYGDIHSPWSSSYSNLLQSAEQNPRWFNSTSVLRPQFIITPNTSNEIQDAIVCSKKYGLQIRVKSGGHDYEGLSFLSETPFIMVDLVNMRSISINMEEETAWVQSGATLGELYYSIAQKSGIHGFPGGLCPSVGIGGHLSGGGFGTLLRKHGLAADHVIDAYLIDASGKVLNRESMGEDLFWAIRGSGGASFGIITAWKINLVRVPHVVTFFSAERSLDNHGIKLVHEWQSIASKLPEDLFIRVVIQNSGSGENKTVVALFESLFLGRVNELVPILNKTFPKLRVGANENFTEMSWIQSVLYFTGYRNGESLEVLLDRTVQYKSPFKAKSDFVKRRVPMNALKEIRDRVLVEEIAFVILDPFGGKMEQVSESEVPFPHRKGNLFNMQYLVKWSGDSEAEAEKHVNWINDLYEFMKPYVSSSPRAAYVNYRDLDLGVNTNDNTSYSEAKIWGEKYFKGNFLRLAQVKTQVDPENYFRSKQSIPLLSTTYHFA